MKGYTKFIVVFALMLTLYIVAEMNRPRVIDWTTTLSKEDKIPYGGYVLYHLLEDIFPAAEIISTREPVYNTLQQAGEAKSAYLLIEPDLNVSKEDRGAILEYVSEGNYVFLASQHPGYLLTDTLKLKMGNRFSLNSKDSTTINLLNPALRSYANYGFRPMTMDAYFSTLDTARSLALGENQTGNINFFSMKIGKGTLFIHALPLCFSNAFLLTRNNSEYTSRVLSYLPKNISVIYWDEYYKLGREGSTNPLRFVLNNTWLRWSFWTGLLAIFTVLFFESKRRQRIIPVVKPLRNSTLDFVRTVGSVYFHHRNNKNLAIKKINHFTDFVRSKFYLTSTAWSNEFVKGLTAKTGMTEAEVNKLKGLISRIYAQPVVDAETLLDVNREIDLYYDRFA